MKRKEEKNERNTIEVNEPGEPKVISKNLMGQHDRK